MEEKQEIFRDVLNSIGDGVCFVDYKNQITFWNHGAEALTGYAASEMVGQQYEYKLLRDTRTNPRPGVNPTPSNLVRMTIEDGKTREEETFFIDSNGKRIPVTVRSVPVHADGKQILGAAEFFSDKSEEMETKRHLEDLKRLAMHDPLTGLFNRRHAEENIKCRLQEMERYGWNFGLLFLDIDHFKNINDTQGHGFGDDVLKAVAARLKLNSRSFDSVGRWGGEEFVAVIVNVTEGQLHMVAEKFRHLIEDLQFSTESGSLGVTVSMGATMAVPGDKVESLVSRSDQLMYRSKVAGRNRITMS